LDGEKGWKTSATVVAKAPEPRSYIVQTKEGTISRRNRRHIQSVPEIPETPETPDRQIVHGHSEVTDGPSLETDLYTNSENGSSPTPHTPTCKRTLAGREVKQPAKFQDYVLG